MPNVVENLISPVFFGGVHRPKVYARYQNSCPEQTLLGCWPDAEINPHLKFVPFELYAPWKHPTHMYPDFCHFLGLEKTPAQENFHGCTHQFTSAISRKVQK